MKILIPFLSIILLYTASNADNWRDVNISKNVTIHKMTYFENHFWGVDYGEGEIYKSTDNGDNWHFLTKLNAEYFEKIQFLDYKNGVVCGDYGYVYRTKDGGKTWIEISPVIENRITKHYRNDTTKNQKPDGMFVAYYDMLFKDTLSGYVSGFKQNPSIGFRESFKRLFYQTKDGGKSWMIVEGKEKVNDFKKLFFEDIEKNKITVESTYFLDEQNAWKITMKKGEKCVSRSKDGGKSWNEYPLQKEVAEKWITRSIVFVNKKEGFVFGGTLGEDSNKAVVYHSKDGGVSWSIYENDWTHIHHAIFRDGKIWVSGKNGLLKKSKSFKSVTHDK